MDLGLINKGGERLNYSSLAPIANRFYNDAKCSISNKITDAKDMFSAGTGLMFHHIEQHFYILLERAIIYLDDGSILGGVVPTNIQEINIVDSNNTTITHNILSVDSGLIEMEKPLQFIDNKIHAISWRLIEVELTSFAANDLYFINDVLDSSLAKVTLPGWDNIGVDGEGVSIRLISQTNRSAVIDRPILIPNTAISGNISTAPYYAINQTVTNFLLFVNNGKSAATEIDFYKYATINKDRQLLLHYIDSSSTMGITSVNGFLNITQIGTSIALTGSRYYHKVLIEIVSPSSENGLIEALYKLTLTASIENAVVQAPKTPKNYGAYAANDIRGFGQKLYNKLGSTESLNNVFLTFMKMWSESDCYNNKISTITSYGFTNKFYNTDDYPYPAKPPLFDQFKIVNGTSEEMGITNVNVVKSNGISWSYI